MKTTDDQLVYSVGESNATPFTCEEDIRLLEDDAILSFIEKADAMPGSMILMATSGAVDLEIDLDRYSLPASSLLIVIPRQKVRYRAASHDFRALAIFNSCRSGGFLEIDVREAIPLFLELKTSPCIALSDENRKILTDLYALLKRVVDNGDAHRGVIRHLFQALFYLSLDIYSSRRHTESKKTSQRFIFESFCNQVYIHYKQERKLKFYSDKLCLTPKYLSLVIRSVSGQSPNDWIDSLVVLEAKTLLKSSKLTIQQICDELNFPSQSFFGKYFKRHTGMSPKRYRSEK